jgi:hypothetical protein
VADLDHVQAGVEDRFEVLAGQVGDHPAAVGAQVAGQPPVHGRPDHRRVGGPAEHGDAGLESFGEGEADHLVEFVAGQRVAGVVGDLLPAAAAAVVHVPPAAGLAVDGAHGDTVLGQQGSEDAADLAADGGAESHRGAQRGDHAGLPDALAAGVDVQLGPVVLVLDGHGQLGRGGEHHDAAHVPMVTDVPRGRAPIR